MGTRHTKERLLEVMGKVNPEFKLITEIKVIDENINKLVESTPELEEPEEQQITPEEQQDAVALEKEAETANPTEEDNQKPVIRQDTKGVDFTVTVPMYKRKLAEKNVKSLIKLAKRLKVSEPEVTYGEPYIVKVKDPRSNIPPYKYFGVNVFDLTLNNMNMFQLPGNYKLVAVVDNMTDGSFEIDENEPVPAEYLKTNGQCDLCKQERYRGKNFIVKDGDSGDYMVLGSGCVKKYIGIDPSKYVRTLNYLRDFQTTMGGFMDEEDLFDLGGREKKGLSEKHKIVDVPKTISIIHAIMDEDGEYVKREWEETERGYGRYEKHRTNDGDATPDKVEKILYNDELYDQFPIDNAYVQEFSEFANTLEPLPPKMVDDYEGGKMDKNQGFNEYRAKVKDLVNADRNLRIYESAFLASAINYFENEKKRMAKTGELKDSQWLGNIGEKIAIPYARLEDMRSGEGQYGTWYLWMLLDDNGNSLKKFGTIGEKFKIQDAPEDAKNLGNFKEGDVFAFTADVKKHDDYKGLKSTMLGRLSKFK